MCIKIIFTAFIFSFFSINVQAFSFSGEKLEVSSVDEIFNLIENSQSSLNLNIKKGIYYFGKQLTIKRNVHISAERGVVFKADKNIKSFIDLSGSISASIDGIIFYLDNNNKGITSKKGSMLSDVQITNNTFLGNSHFVSSPHQEGNIAIHLNGASDTNIIGNEIRDSFGGIYVSGSKIIVKSNVLERVNFGNIVFTGKGILIEDNFVNESGKGSNFHHPSGDTITIGGGSEDITVLNNYFDTSYCYIMWAHGPLKNILISHNMIRGGVTSALAIEGAHNVIIRDNIFEKNLANAILMSKGGNDVDIKSNIFIKNPIFISSEVQNVTIEDNLFKEIYRETLAHKYIKNIDDLKNDIIYADFSKNESLQLIYNESFYNNGDVLEVDSDNNKGSLEIEIFNPTKYSVNLYGVPQVDLSHGIINNSRGDRSAGSRKVLGYELKPIDQPNILYLDPGKKVSFTVNYNELRYLGGVRRYINIPNELDFEEGFWIELQSK